MNPPLSYHICFLTTTLLLLASTVLTHDVDDIYEEEYNEFDFFDEYEAVDKGTGGALKFSSKGRMSPQFVNVDENYLIKKVKCEEDEADVVMLAVEVGTDIIVPGVLLFGGPEWGCPSNVDDNLWEGLLRRVVTVTQKTDTIIHAVTEEAKFMDLFEHSHIKFHYKPGSRDNAETMHRSKRATTAAGISVAQWVTMIEFAVTSEEAMNISVNNQFVIESPNPAVPYSMVCNPCAVNMTFGLSFELSKNPEIPETHYKLSLEGDLSADIVVDVSIGTELSKVGHFTNDEVTEFNFPAILLSVAPEPGLPNQMLNLSAKVGFDAMVNLQTKGPVAMKTRTAFSGSFQISVEIIDGSRNEPEFEIIYTEAETLSEILAQDIQGTAKNKIAFCPVIEIIPMIQWVYGKGLHWIDTQTPIIVKPCSVNMMLATMEDDIVCLEGTSTGIMNTSNIDVKIDYSVFANPVKYWGDNLDPNNTAWLEPMWDAREFDCMEESCCVVNCFGENETPDDDRPLDEVIMAEALVPSTSLLDLGSGGGPVVYLGDPKFTGSFAAPLLKLIKFVAANRPGTKLIVLLGYNTAQAGYNEGRAAQVQMSGVDSDAPDSDSSLLPRLSQLAVCAGFHYAKVAGSSVEIGMMKAAPLSDNRVIFNRIIEERAPSIQKSVCDAWPALFPALAEGETNPVGKTPEEACGPVDDKISRMEPKFASLYHYKFDDLTFLDEERHSAWCTSDARLCVECDPAEEEPFKWCADRVSTAYTAFLLRRFASLLEQAGGTGKVVNAFVEPTADQMTYDHPHADMVALNFEARAATIEISGIGTDVASALAACASFDYVEVLEDNKLYVCARKSSADGLLRVQFVSNQLITVDPPISTDDFDWPKAYLNWNHRVPLFDSSGIESLALARGFLVSHFKYPGARYFRMDLELVYCLDLVQWNTEYTLSLVPGAAYKTKSANNFGKDLRMPQEVEGHAAGLAAEVVLPEDVANNNNFIRLAKKFLRRCAPKLRTKNLGVGVGLHPGHVFLQILENPNQDGTVYTQYWMSPLFLEPLDNETREKYEKVFENLQRHLYSGGVEISPLNEERVCKNHPFAGDKDKAYFSFKMAYDRESCQSEEWDELCALLEEERTKVYHKVKTNILAMTQPDNRLHEYFFQGLKGCLVHLCGKCSGDGPTWANKVHNCTDVIKFFTLETSHESYHDFHVFNLQTLDDDIHELACAKPQMCISKTAGNSIFAEAMEAKVRIDPEKDSEEYLHGSANNPLPLLVAYYQSVMIQVTGNVTVWISEMDDFEALFKQLKVLFIYNEDVDTVNFKFLDMQEQDVAILMDMLARRMEMWAGSACPDHTRASVAPITMEILPASRRRKRSALSPAEFLRHRHKNWELDWVMRN